nr:MAG TPA: hypothetical protein [Caudoviricetes sp.]
MSILAPTVSAETPVMRRFNTSAIGREGCRRNSRHVNLSAYGVCRDAGDASFQYVGH